MQVFCLIPSRFAGPSRYLLKRAIMTSPDRFRFTSSLSTFHVVFLACLLSCPISTDADDALTSTTLTLDSLFTATQPQTRPPMIRWPKLVQPEADSPASEPTINSSETAPTSKPAIDFDAIDLPRLPIRGTIKKAPSIRESDTPLMQDRGRTAQIKQNQSFVEIENEFTQLNLRLTLTPLERPEDKLVLLLPAGQSDRFYLVPGEYDVLREVWRPWPDSLPMEEHFPRQTLRSAWTYSVNLTASEERILTAFLDDPRRSRRF